MVPDELAGVVDPDADVGDAPEPLSLEEIKASRRIVPPIALRSTPTDPAEPWVPDAVRKRVASARAAGLEPRLYRAIGPRLDQHGYVADPECRTLGLRIKIPGCDVAALWTWRGDLKEPGWRFDGAWIAPGRPHEVEGAPYQFGREKVGISIVDAAIKGRL